MLRNRLLFLILVTFFTLLRFGYDSFSSDNQQTLGALDRKILAANETSNGEIIDYYSTEDAATSSACDSEFDHTVGIIFFIIGVLYCFVGLAIICEGEFKDSVVELARFFKMSPDVAGATLMAAGTSSPELFTALVAVAGPVGDIGTGTIVGSALFNMLVIIGSCVIFTSYIFHLDWKSVIRDCVINYVSFLFLFAVFWDSTVHWYEAFFGVFLYLLYVAMMAVNERLMRLMTRTAVYLTVKLPFLERLKVEPTTGTSEGLLSDNFDDGEGGYALENFSPPQHPEGEDIPDDFIPEPVPVPPTIEEEKEFEEVQERVEHIPATKIGWVWYVLAWPYELVFRYTIPPVKGRFKYQFFASFFMSLAWLALLTVFMVKWSEKIGCIAGIEDAIMGVTFLAVGTSMPDCLTSIFVARMGKGNMAVCNALGSNIFDILLALSLPWCLAIVISREPIDVFSPTLVSDVLILTGTMTAFIVTMMCTKWHLTRRVGYFFFSMYGLFVIYTVLKELGLGIHITYNG